MTRRFFSTRLATLTALVLLATLAAPHAQAQDKVGTTAAAFLTMGVGARATAMGGAQVAAAQGPSALHWNPSATAFMPTSGATFTNSEWLVDTRLNHAAAVLDLPFGHVGLQLLALDYGEEDVTTIERPEGTGERWSALDMAIGVSYARALTDRFAIGGTVKYIRQEIWNSTATGAALDLGVTYITGYRGLRIGMSFANFGSDMQMSGQDLRNAIDIAERIEGNNPRLAANLETGEWALPLTFRVGVAVNALETSAQRLTLTADGQAPSDNAQSANFGAEYAFRELFFVRGGYRQAFASVTDDGGWTVGAGLRYALSQQFAGSFDYTFQHVNVFGVQQMFSVEMTF